MKYLILIAILVLNSCSQDVKVQRDPIPSSGFLLLGEVNSSPAISFLDGSTYSITTDDVISLNNEFGLMAIPDKAIKYDKEIYFLFKNEKLIQVYSLLDFSYITEYDFSDSGLTPKDLAFPNSSNIYTIFENSNKMIIIDRQFQEISNFSFDLPANSISFDSKADNIFIACDDSKIHQFKTNSKQIINSFTTHGLPEIVRSDPFKNEIIVISDGDKENINGSSFIYFLSITDLAVIAENELSERFDDHEQMVSNNISFTDNELEFAYLTTDQGFIRIDTRNKGVYIFVDYSDSDLVYYNFTYQEIYTYTNSNSTLEIYNASNSSLLRAVELPSSTSYIIPNN